jgi:tetratricopeptide (TPR) repeat protein
VFTEAIGSLTWERMVAFPKRSSRTALTLWVSIGAIGLAIGTVLGPGSVAAGSVDAPVTDGGRASSDVSPSSGVVPRSAGSTLPSVGRPEGVPVRPPRAPALKREYVDACERGNSQVLQRDFAGAVASYRMAIAQSVHEPLGYYLLGEAELAAGNFAEAETSWQRALAESERDPALHARTLFVLADLRERQKMWDAARVAWQAYIDWLDRSSVPGFPASARSRQEAIERMTRQDRAYEVVRERIRETSDGGVFSNAAAGTTP